MNETAPLSVTCSATSKPAASYIWYTKSGEAASDGSILSFRSLRRTDSNEYECKALNAAGSKMSSRLTVIVQCKSIVLDYVHTMPAHFEMVKNSTDRPPVHTETAHFCRQILETVDFENGTLTDTFLKWHRVNA